MVERNPVEGLNVIQHILLSLLEPPSKSWLSPTDSPTASGNSVVKSFEVQVLDLTELTSYNVVDWFSPPIRRVNDEIFKTGATP